jgi:hypothetical protein
MCDICGGMTDDDYAMRIAGNIQVHGWTVQYVLGEDRRNPPFGYTLGLSLRGHPEFIIFNCPQDGTYKTLEPLAQAVLGGRRFDEGDDLSEFYAGPEKAQLLRFPDSSTHLYAANSMFRQPGQPPVAALQVVWPSQAPLLAATLGQQRRERGGR